MKDKISKNTSNAIYGLGFIGALFFFLSTATSFGMGLIGIIKAMFWPAFLVYYLFAFIF